MRRSFTFENAAYLCVFLFFVVLAAVQFDFYAIPHNDFIQFLDATRWMINLHAPDSYKIMPLYPFLGLIVARLIPGNTSLLFAFQLVSLFSAGFFLVFLMLLGRKYLPGNGPLFLVFVIVNPYFWEFALQPLLEMPLCAMIAASLYFYSRRSDWGYWLAGLAAVARYDAVFLLPLEGCTRYFTEGRKVSHLWKVALAGLGFTVWMLLSALHSRVLNPYIEQMIDIRADYALFPLLRMLGRMLVGGFPEGDPLSWLESGLLILVGLVVAAGVRRLWRTDRAFAVVTVGFALSYLAVHGLFVAVNYRYVYPVLVLLQFFFLGAMETGEVQRKEGLRRWIPAGVILVTGCSLAWLGTPTFDSFHLRVMWAASIVIAGVALMRRGEFSPRGWILPLAWPAVVMMLWLNLKSWEENFIVQHQWNSEYASLYQWARKNCTKGEIIACAAPWYMRARYESDEDSLAEAKVNPDMELDFQNDDRHLLVRGWSDFFEGDPGARSIWAVGRSSEVLLRDDSPHRDGRLNLVLFPMQGKNLPAQGIEVQVNGHSLGHRELAGREGRYVFDIPATFLVPGANRFTFLYDYCAVPKEVGIGEDVRPLSVMFKKIQFESSPRKSSRPEFIGLESFQAMNAWSFIKECQENKIEYVAWTSSIGRFGRSNWFHIYSKGYLLNELNLMQPGAQKMFRLTAVLFGDLGSYTYVYRFQPGLALRAAGSCLDVNSGWQAREWLTDGWSEVTEGRPGDRYIWALGQQSGFQYVIEKLPVRDPKLTFLAYPFQVPGLPPQRIRVSLNGKLIGSVDMAAKQRLYEVPIPAQYFKTGENRFRFEYRYCASPREKGLGRDRRPLAVLFKKICVLTQD